MDHGGVVRGWRPIVDSGRVELEVPWSDSDERMRLDEQESGSPGIEAMVNIALGHYPFVSKRNADLRWLSQRDRADGRGDDHQGCDDRTELVAVGKKCPD